MSAIIRRPFWRRIIQAGNVVGSAQMTGEAYVAAAGTVLQPSGSMRCGIFQPPVYGHGPGRDTGAPIWRCVVETPGQASEITGILDRLEQFDMIGAIQFAGGRNVYAPNNVFSRPLYLQQVKRYVPPNVSNQVFNRIVNLLNSKRIIAYAVDEANRVSDFGDTFNPDDVNYCGNVHKTLFGSGCTVAVRMGQHSMADGWNNLPRVAGWPGIDYGWAQRGGQHNPQTPEAYYRSEAQGLAATGVNLGLITGLNLWSGGLVDAPVAGVNHCWDTLNNGGGAGSIDWGVITGSQSSNIGIPDGTFIACGSIPANLNRTIANPLWIRRVAEGVRDMTDTLIAPVFFNWQDTANGVTDLYEPYFIRPDFVAAFDYMCNQISSRTLNIGWRATKPGQLVPV